MEQQKNISIITICYNNLAGLRATVESVLAQTTRDYEFIIIDGGSNDGTKEYLESVSDRVDYWVSEPDGGIYSAMNKGIVRATGRYCNFMNSGDSFYAPDVLERVIPRLGEKDFYIGHQQNQGTNTRIIRVPEQIRAHYIALHFMPHQAAFIRTPMLKARPYDTSLRMLADWKQMLEEMVIHGASYEALPFFVACFDTTGVSHQEEWNHLYREEVDRVLGELFPRRLKEALQGYDKISTKVFMALGEPHPISRDLKLLRNAFKQLVRDLAGSLLRR